MTVETPSGFSPLQENGKLYENHPQFIQKYHDDYEPKKVEAYQIEQRAAELLNEFANLDKIANLQLFAFYIPRYGFESSSRKL